MPFVPRESFRPSYLLLTFSFFRRFDALEVDDRQLIKALYGRMPLLLFFFVFGLYFFYTELLSNRKRYMSQNRGLKVKSINDPCRNIFIRNERKT